MLFEPLPSTDEDSPSPTLSELSQYFWHKVSKSQKASKSSKASKDSTTPTKVLPLRRIPLFGTPVKLEASTLRLGTSTIKRDPKPKIKLDSDVTKPKVKTDLNASSSSCESSCELGKMDQCVEEGIQIAHLKPRFSEFTHIFPAFPKTHSDGYAYIIELSSEILNEKSLLDLRDALQYSLTGGGGNRVLENVKFFAVEGEKVPMKIHYRVCAGIFSKCLFFLIIRCQIL